MVDLAALLRKRGHTVAVACPDEPWMVQELCQSGIQPFVINFRKLGWAISALVKAVRRERPQIIHSHLSRATYASVAAGAITGVPLAATVHVRSGDLAYRLAARRSSRIIAVSEFIKGHLASRGVPAKAIDVVPNGTDFGQKPGGARQDILAEFGIPPESRVIGLIGRVSREKGHHLAVESLPAILAEEPLAHMLFVGRIAENEFTQSLSARIAELGLSSKVTLTGGRTDVARLIDAMEFTILPSEMEACPLVALEAMARGKPLVASPRGGLVELVHPGENGELVELESDAMARAMLRILKTPGLAEDMGRKAKSMIEVGYTTDRMAEKLEQVYTQVAKSA